MKRLGTLLTLAVSLILLAAAGTYAQGPGQRSHSMSAQRDLNTASDLIGTKVENQQGQSLGSVIDLLVDPQGARVQYVVLSRGGVLGVGSKLYPVPWEVLRYSIQGDRFILNISEDKLASAPNFARESWPDLSSGDWRQRIQSYYEGQGMGTDEHPQAAGKDLADSGKSLVRASKLMGKPLQNSQGQRLGSIDNLVIDRSTGKVEYAVIGSGGVLGVGEKLHAVPWESVNYDSGRQTLTLDATKQKIDNAPSFTRDKWPNMSDPAWQSQVDRYFSVQGVGSGQSAPLRGE